MTPQAALIELLARVGAGNGAVVLVSDEELSQWPAAAVAAMKSQKLLAKARPAVSVVCPGCERACVMPVHTLPRASGAAGSFIVCDKRSDINRVPVSAERQKQWRCDANAVCGFIAASLGLRHSDQHPADAGLLKIGIASGSKRHQMVCLQPKGDLALVAANNAAPLAELVGYRDGEYSVDGDMIRQLLDSATTADSLKAIEPLQEMFASAILKLAELPPEPKDERVYDLNSLRQKGFDFVFDAGSGIQDVAVRKLRLSSKVKKGDRITLEADATNNSNAVYELLDQIGKSLPLHLYNVTQVELAASVIVDADKPPKAVTIRITHPNSCSLKYDQLDLKLRDMLHASGIEPKEPPEATSVVEAAVA
jgi:hypothetical protein